MTGLRADCARCAGLCCVAPGFTASADFAISKEPGRPCPHLRRDFGCEIHERLRPSGFPGCATYDCFGAGQQVTQVTFGGKNWRQPGVAAAMFASFAVMRQLHELRWHVTQALALTRELPQVPGAEPVAGPLSQAETTLRRHAESSPEALAALDIEALWGTVTGLLRHASQLIRGSGPADRELSGADLMGHDLAGADLRRASLRGACLIGANLARADLRLADLAGADLRGARLAGADLSTSLFLTQAQADAARGDATTNLPAGLARPAHWAG